MTYSTNSECILGTSLHHWRVFRAGEEAEGAQRIWEGRTRDPVRAVMGMYYEKKRGEIEKNSKKNVFILLYYVVGRPWGMSGTILRCLRPPERVVEAPTIQYMDFHIF